MHHYSLKDYNNSLNFYLINIGFPENLTKKTTLKDELNFLHIYQVGIIITIHGKISEKIIY